MSYKMYCPGGHASQTGVATAMRYDDIDIISSCEKISELLKKLDSSFGPHVIPIWNSHQGSITPAEFIWDLIEDSKIKIYDLWPKKIEFWHVKRNGSKSAFGKVGSVQVAETQCSNYFLENSIELAPYGLTTTAFDDYKSGAKLDGVLIAPQTNLEPGFECVSIATANLYNFTSFITFMVEDRLTEEYEIYLTAVMIMPIDDGLGDVEQALFEGLFSRASHINEIHRLTYVVSRTGRTGLLFEGAKLFAGDILDADQISNNNIGFYEEVGVLEKSYSDELRDFFDEKFQNLNNSDFILHVGQASCMFACPLLGIYTHGYDVATVEPVVRFYISQFFEAIYNGIECTKEQMELFNRHKNTWESNQSNFIVFTQV